MTDNEKVEILLNNIRKLVIITTAQRNNQIVCVMDVDVDTQKLIYLDQKTIVEIISYHRVGGNVSNVIDSTLTEPMIHRRLPINEISSITL